MSTHSSIKPGIKSQKFPNIRFVPKNCYSPNFSVIQSWIFPFEENSIDSESSAQLEANLADAIARVASFNGMSNNDIHHLFPSILRMLKSTSDWSK